MKCPFCNTDDTQVINTRISEDRLVIKRRRQCISCGKRYNTLEKIEFQMPSVVKTDGSRQDYDPDKIKNSFVKALHKRPVSSVLVDHAIDTIVQKILSIGVREINSSALGEMVMEELAKLDKVAYIRFASIYRSFNDLTDFNTIIRQVKKTGEIHN